MHIESIDGSLAHMLFSAVFVTFLKSLDFCMCGVVVPGGDACVEHTLYQPEGHNSVQLPLGN